MRLVCKYGGTSLGDTRCICRAARRAVADVARGHQVVLVVSAQGDTTDALVKKARALTPCPDKRELDALLSTGECVSAALMAMAISAQGGRGRSLTGREAGIYTDGCHTNARILSVRPEGILRAWEEGFVPVVAGFQGVAPNGSTTTLGRGGSDTTAAYLAVALRADCCKIFTDVEGVYDRDPRVCADAKKYSAIDYGDMLALARSGAQVLHYPCVELAAREGLRLEVLSAFTDAPGTVVGHFKDSRKIQK